MSEVNLVAISKPNVGVTDCWDANELIAYTARVSNPANQSNRDTAPKLLRYLIKHQHWSPFEMVHMTLEIKTTRDISRQIIRHRSFSYQEFSQRYAESENFSTRMARMQDPENRQASVDIAEEYGVGSEGVKSSQNGLVENWNMKQRKVISAAKEAYNWALDNGIAKEQARVVLPEGNTCTTLYMAGSLRSWIHFCQLRMGIETQKEHRIVAEQCWEHIKTHFPDIAEAVMENE
ncbi:FAD-dependent thymidylate synthase [Planktomarina sp.]|uniref:FAD-dependent thymidylate synthase n=1 Tax=Planktomarina sp. TaxID=2024851 RepID=UPI0032618B34